MDGNANTILRKRRAGEDYQRSRDLVGMPHAAYRGMRFNPRARAPYHHDK